MTFSSGEIFPEKSTHTLLSNPQATEDLKVADYSNLLKENMYILNK